MEKRDQDYDKPRYKEKEEDDYDDRRYNERDRGYNKYIFWVFMDIY